MRDFWVAIGLVLVLEGVLFAGFPAQAKRAMQSVLETPDETLRVVGIVSAVLGVVLVALLRWLRPLRARIAHASAGPATGSLLRLREFAFPTNSSRSVNRARLSVAW